MAYLYKAPYGDDGLSANLWEMEKGELAGYRALYVDNKIGLLSFGGLVVWSILKFLRRVLL